MFKNVLVGVDGSVNGHDAVRLASHLTDPEGKLTFAHVRPGKPQPLHAITPERLAQERDVSEQLLERELALAEVSAEAVSVVSTSPGRGLHQHAEDLNADLLVVGSCGRGVFGRAMLGDDTRAALNGAPCAVAIAARGYSEYPVPIARIGVGYNGSRESEAALDLARTLAAGTRATVACGRSRLDTELWICRRCRRRQYRSHAHRSEQPHEGATRRRWSRRLRGPRGTARHSQRQGRSSRSRLSQPRPGSASRAGTPATTSSATPAVRCSCFLASPSIARPRARIRRKRTSLAA